MRNNISKLLILSALLEGLEGIKNNSKMLIFLPLSGGSENFLGNLFPFGNSIKNIQNNYLGKNFYKHGVGNDQNQAYNLRRRKVIRR